MPPANIMIDYKRIKADIAALGLLALVVFLGLSLVSFDPADPPTDTVFPSRTAPANLCGPAGATIAWHLRSAFGLGAWFLLVLLVSSDLRLFASSRLDGWKRRVLGVALALTGFCAGIHMLSPALGGGPIVGSGGYLGAWSNAILESHFQLPGMLMIIAACLAAGLLLATENRALSYVFAGLSIPAMASPGLFRRFSGGGLALRERLFRRRVTPDDVESEYDDETDELVEDEPNQIRVNPPPGLRERLGYGKQEAPLSVATSSNSDYELPSVELLTEPEEFPYELLAKKARLAAQTLEQAFEEFGLNIKVKDIDTGPVITQFELELEKGLRLNKVTALADDLAIALRVPSVRVVAPIPGKNTVGIEVPNEKQVMVRLRELIENSAEDTEKVRVPLFLGKDVSGRPMVVDMTRMPHLLIAGRTGTGKSVCLNSLILSILMTRTPDEVRMLMIDPKMVELSPYKRVPHLMHPVITDMKKAEAVLAWAVDKMEERYDLLARCGVRHLDSFNKLERETVLKRLGVDAESEEAEAVPERMPYIVIIADEMADLMMTSGKDVEGHIIRLAQKSRAVGIHLVLATQKPTVDVVTGLIKSNLPARISFQVASKMDSRVVLDEMGAERLLGNGDMLYLAPGTSNVTRSQGTFVSDDEVMDVIDFFSDQEPEYSAELAQITSGNAAGGSGASSDRVHDDMYEAAIEVVIREGRGSVSLLQRCLSIGYGRAARLIDYMAEDGIVGDYNGAQARQVLYTPDQWEEFKAGQDEDVDEEYEDDEDE